MIADRILKSRSTAENPVRYFSIHKVYFLNPVEVLFGNGLYLLGSFKPRS
jgi:hypothetical protein